MLVEWEVLWHEHIPERGKVRKLEESREVRTEKVLKPWAIKKAQQAKTPSLRP